MWLLIYFASYEYSSSFPDIPLVCKAFHLNRQEQESILTYSLPNDFQTLFCIVLVVFSEIPIRVSKPYIRLLALRFVWIFHKNFSGDRSKQPIKNRFRGNQIVFVSTRVFTKSVKILEIKLSTSSYSFQFLYFDFNHFDCYSSLTPILFLAKSIPCDDVQ